MGWEIDPPYKAYEEWERWHDAPDDDVACEEPEYDHDWKLVCELEDRYDEQDDRRESDGW